MSKLRSVVPTIRSRIPTTSKKTCFILFDSPPDQKRLTYSLSKRKNKLRDMITVTYIFSSLAFTNVEDSLLSVLLVFWNIFLMCSRDPLMGDGKGMIDDGWTLRRKPDGKKFPLLPSLFCCSLGVKEGDSIPTRELKKGDRENDRVDGDGHCLYRNTTGTKRYWKRTSTL